jgi:hypothetical protein
MAELIHEDGRTDRRDEADRRFSQFIWSRLITIPITRREIAAALKSLSVLKKKTAATDLSVQQWPSQAVTVIWLMTSVVVILTPDTPFGLDPSLCCYNLVQYLLINPFTRISVRIIIHVSFKTFPELAGIIYRNCCMSVRNVCWHLSSPLGCGQKKTSRKMENNNWFLLHNNAPAHRPVFC